jgi:Holliday junction resolvasome RuvABC endonuclease subunit
MTILTIDIGTTTGWCLRANGATVSGSLDLRGDRHEGAGMRFVRFEAWLIEMHRQQPIKAVFYEDVQAHKGHYAGQVYAGLRSILMVFCERNKIPYAGVGVGKIKKFATGKGNAGKDAVIAAVRAYGFSPADDNEADAIALMLYSLEQPSAAVLA